MSTKLWSVLKKGFNRKDCGRQATSCPGNVTDAEWDGIKDFFTPDRPGRPPKHERRAIRNAIRHVQRTGCQWRLPPTDFPPWRAVHMAFHRQRRDGLWTRINAHLRRRAGIQHPGMAK